jgi:hypothetical protein
MDIIVRNLDSMVLFDGEGLTLTDNGAAGSGWAFPGANPEQYKLYSGVTLPEGFAPGQWSFDGNTWTNVPPPPPPIPVPQSVTRFQAFAALTNAGLYAQAMNAVNAAGGLTLLAWNNALNFERSSPSIAAIAASLNLTSEQVDALFVAGSQIQA